jgi:pyruvate carboxylase subunit B
MKFFVTIGRREIAVDIDGDQVRIDGREMAGHLSPVPGTPLRHLLLDQASLTLTMERRGAGEWLLGLHGTQHEVRVVDERTRHIESLTGGGEARVGPSVLKAPMPGLVVRVLAAPGQVVEPGQGLVVLEAMKMENELRATARGVVGAIPVVPGQAVEKGQLLMEFGTAPNP